jgi:hypothetical protein
MTELGLTLGSQFCVASGKGEKRFVVVSFPDKLENGSMQIFTRELPPHIRQTNTTDSLEIAADALTFPDGTPPSFYHIASAVIRF